MPENRLHPDFTITNAITTALTQIERARGFLEAATLSENWVQAMGRRALVLEAHHTTHIEGTRLTLDQAKVLGYVMEHGALTIGACEALCPDINRRSLQRDLKGMLDKGVLVAEGATNRLQYRLRGKRKT